MERYRVRKGSRITYSQLSEKTRIAVPTLRAVGSRLGYHPTLANIEKICRALDVTPGDLLEIIDDPPRKKTKGKKSKKRSKAAK